MTAFGENDDDDRRDPRSQGDRSKVIDRLTARGITPWVPGTATTTPEIETGLLELWDPGTGEVVFSCRPSLTGESLIRTATRSGVKLRH
jgi:hypothetical protein